MDRKKLNISGKAIIAGMVILVIIISAAVYLNLQNKTDNDNGYTFTVSKNDKFLIEYTLEEIKKMPSVKALAKINSTNKKSYEGIFTGVPIEYVLDQADKRILKECSNFIFIAGDGFSTAVSKSDLKTENNIILAYAMDGKELAHFSEGGQGPMRIIILSDQFGNRSAMWTIKVECRS